MKYTYSTIDSNNDPFTDWFEEERAEEIDEDDIPEQDDYSEDSQF